MVNRIIVCQVLVSFVESTCFHAYIFWMAVIQNK